MTGGKNGIRARFARTVRYFSWSNQPEAALVTLTI